MVYKFRGPVEIASILTLALVLVALDPAELPLPLLPLPVQLPALLGLALFGFVAVGLLFRSEDSKNTNKSPATDQNQKEVAIPDAGSTRVNHVFDKGSGTKVVIPNKYFGVSALRRKIHVYSVRLDNGGADLSREVCGSRIDMLELWVQRDQDGWSVWRTLDDLRALFEALKREPGAAASIPALPSFITSTEAAKESLDAASIKRHLSLISAWLQLLNETPSVRDRPELAMFLDDERNTNNAALSDILSPNMLSKQRSVDTSDRFERASSQSMMGVIGSYRSEASSFAFSSLNEDVLLSIPSAGVSGTSSPASSSSSQRKPMRQRIKEATQRAFGGKSKLIALSDAIHPACVADDAASVGSDRVSVESLSQRSGSVPEAASSENPGGVNNSYASWLREQQEELGFIGHDFETFEYTDISEEARAQFKDTGPNSGFTVRGATYLYDKRKVHPGPALCRLLCLETFAVDVSKDGDRHDHVSCRPAVRRRIDAVLSLRDPPFLFVMNFQIPGTPPVSMVSIYALPPQYARDFGVVSRVPHHLMADTSIPRTPLPLPDEQYRVTVELLREYAALPSTDAGRLALWGIEAPEEEKEMVDEVLPLKESVENVQNVNLHSQAVATTSSIPVIAENLVPLSRYPSADTTDFSTVEPSGDGSVYSAGNGSCTTGILTATEDEANPTAMNGAPSKPSHNKNPESVFSKRYLKNLAKEALGRQREAERKAAALIAQQQQLEKQLPPQALGSPEVAGAMNGPGGASSNTLSSPGDSSVASGYSFGTATSAAALSVDDIAGSNTGEKKKRFRLFKSISKLMGRKSRRTSADGFSAAVSSSASLNSFDTEQDGYHSTGYASDSGFESDGDGTASRASFAHADSDNEGFIKAPDRTTKSTVQPPSSFGMGIAEIAPATESSAAVSNSFSTPSAAAVLSDSVMTTKPPIRKQASTASTAASSATSVSSYSSWKMPSDITWPDPHEAGVFPPLDIRNRRFKLIPRIVDGPWIVRTAVRSQPAILGHKVVQRFFRGNGYIETDVYVGSSIIASNIVGICRGYAKNFTCEIGIVLQGETDEELPEKLLSCITMIHPDPDVNRCID